MSAMDFEYAIKKDVRNNPIVREVDEARQRELWRSTVIGALLLVVVLLFSAWQHFELLRHGYAIETLQRERAAEEEVNRQLRLEIETLRSPQRIEELATEQLHLVRRRRDEAIVIERVTPPAPPVEVDRRRALAVRVRRIWWPSNRAEHSVFHGPDAAAASAPVDWRTTVRTRLVVGAVLFGVWTAGIEARLVYLQVVAVTARSCSRAPKQQHAHASPRRPSAARSSIATAACSPTASTPTRSSPFPPRSTTRTPSPRRCARALDDCDATDRQAMAKKLRGSGQFAYLAAPGLARRSAADSRR